MICIAHKEPAVITMIHAYAELVADATKRLSLEAVANHSWVVRGYGPVQ